MKKSISTSIEQSRRLLSCGVDPKTADMVWLNRGQYPAFLSFNEGCNRAIPEVGDVPAWSLSALLALLPKEIYDDDTDSYYFSLSKEFPLSEEYGVAYIPCWEKGDAIVRKRYDSPIEACVQMIEWLCESGYSLNKIEE
ncbi:MAG: hypothetical protein NC548_36885 [Lachnospiraceae bacterium]|nr:hypothetical protein [Lachnospiraceae bacterium]